jgi:hypothetical protein
MVASDFHVGPLMLVCPNPHVPPQIDGAAELYHGAAGKSGNELTFDSFFPVRASSSGGRTGR